MTTHARSLPANERLKRRFDEILAGSLIGAAMLHLLVLQLWPPISVRDVALVADEPPVVLRLDELDLPPTPEPLPRPVAPVPVANASAEATIEPMDFTGVRELAPPPPSPTEAVVERSTITPYEVAPRLLNPAEFQRALERAYPAVLRDSGVGGLVVLTAYIGEDGRVLEARLSATSGFERLDETALGLTDLMRFSPAINRDRAVAVWVELPVEFRVRR